MKRKSLKLVVSGLVITMLGGIFVGCSGENTDSASTVSISGSTSVGPLMERVSEKYESIMPNVSVEINQVGSSAGIKDVINGTSNIAMSSRDLKQEEEAELIPKIVAYDGIALIVNKNNPIQNLSLEQVKDIYTGKITKWNEIEGGLDNPIVVISREEGSGTRSAFQEIIGYKSEALISDAAIADGNGNIKATVEGNENAIGFVSFEYLDDSIASLAINGVKPEAQLVKEGKYVISRPFVLAVKKNNENPESKKLIEYLLSEDGQKVVKENKLIPIK